MAAKKSDTGLVRVLIPDRYGAFHAERDDDKRVVYKGGEIGEVTPRQAEIYGLEPLDDDPAPSVKSDVPPKAKDAAAEATKATK